MVFFLFRHGQVREGLSTVLEGELSKIIKFEGDLLKEGAKS